MPAFPPEIGSIWVARFTGQTLDQVRLPLLGEMVATVSTVSVNYPGPSFVELSVYNDDQPTVLRLLDTEWQVLDASHLSHLRQSMTIHPQETSSHLFIRGPSTASGELTLRGGSGGSSLQVAPGGSLRIEAGAAVSLDGENNIHISAADPAKAQRAILDSIKEGLLAVGVWQSKSDPNVKVSIRDVTCNPSVVRGGMALSDPLQVGDIEVRFVTPTLNDKSLNVPLEARTLAQFLVDFEAHPPKPDPSTSPTLWERLSQDD